MSTSSASSSSTVSTHRTVETNDILLGVLVLALGLAAVAGLGLTDVGPPGILDTDTAFLLLGGAVLVVTPATFLLLYRAKENHRRLDEHERLSTAQIETLEQDVDRSVREAEVAPELTALRSLAREHSEDHDRQERTLERIEGALTEDRLQARTVETRLEEIAARQEAMFSEVLGRQEQAFQDQQETLRQTVGLEEARITSLLDRQERMLGRQKPATTGSHQQSRGTEGEPSTDPMFPREGLMAARALEEGEQEPLEARERTLASPEEAELEASDPTSQRTSPDRIQRELEEQTVLLKHLVDTLSEDLDGQREKGSIHRDAPDRGAILEERPRYPVATYTVDEIPTVGAAEARRLGTYGVNLTDTLLHTDLDRLADATGLDRAWLRTSRDTAELMCLDGLGPELSARLVNLGVSSIEELARLDPDELSNMLLETYEDVKGEDNDVMARTLPRRCEKIIDRARQASIRLHPYRAA